VVIRDWRGNCLAASNKFIERVTDVAMVEAIGQRERLLLVQHIGGNWLIVQSDCLQVAETTRDGGFSPMAAAAIYECNIIMWHGFDRVSIEHCNRD
jgi:hypothetical protein